MKHCRLGLLLLGVALHAQAQLYIYQNADGQRLVSDRPLSRPGYHLLTARDAVRGTGALVADTGDWWRGDNRSARFDREIGQAAQTHQLDPALIKAVIHVESHFNPHALSHAGAQGLMQLMPATAARYRVNNPYDAGENIHAGSRHLAYLLQRYRNHRHALAAYNAGEQAVARYGGIPPYRETQRYVQRVLTLYQRYQGQQLAVAR